MKSDQSRLFRMVITGDLVGSSTLEDRLHESRRIARAVRQVSKDYADALVGPLSLRGIDEISGVFSTPHAAYSLCLLLNEIVHPIYFRYALVYDELDIGVETRDASRMDGPAFHRASDLMAWLKRKDMLFGIKLCHLREEENQLLSQLANLAGILSIGRSNQQNEIVRLYRRYTIQRDVAKHLRISQQAVSQSLRASHWKHVASTESLIQEYLRKVIS